MIDSWGSLHVQVLDDEIIIALPGSHYTVTYYMPPNSPQLLARNFPKTNDSRVPMTQAENGPGGSPMTKRASWGGLYRRLRLAPFRHQPGPRRRGGLGICGIR